MLDWSWRNYQPLSQKAALANRRRKDGIIRATASVDLAIVSLQLLLPSVHCTCWCHDTAFPATSFAAIIWSRSYASICLGPGLGKGTAVNKPAPTRQRHSQPGSSETAEERICAQLQLGCSGLLLCFPLVASASPSVPTVGGWGVSHYTAEGLLAAHFCCQADGSHWLPLSVMRSGKVPCCLHWPPSSTSSTTKDCTARTS